MGIILLNVYTPHYNLPSQRWMLHPFPFLYINKIKPYEII